LFFCEFCGFCVDRREIVRLNRSSLRPSRLPAEAH